MKKYGLLLAALLVLSALLSACGTESQDSAKDYVEALLKGDTAKAQEFACEDYKDATAELTLVDLAKPAEGQAIRNIDLKYDLGKGNNQKEVIVTGSYDIVTLNAEGKTVTDSEIEFDVAASARDKRDLDGDGEDEDKVNSSIRLEMEKDGDDWCVAKFEGGYYTPEFE